MGQIQHTLILVRHGKPEWKASNNTDFSRKLTGEGKRQAVQAGNFIYTNLKGNYGFFTSPAERASETAQLIASGSGDPVKIQKSLYLAPLSTLIKLISEYSESLSTAVIIGHNPGLTELINYFSNSNIDNLPVGGTVIIEFNGQEWKNILEGTGKITEYIFPSLGSGILF